MRIFIEGYLLKVFFIWNVIWEYYDNLFKIVIFNGIVLLEEFFWVNFLYVKFSDKYLYNYVIYIGWLFLFFSMKKIYLYKIIMEF